MSLPGAACAVWLEYFQLRGPAVFDHGQPVSPGRPTVFAVGQAFRQRREDAGMLFFAHPQALFIFRRERGRIADGDGATNQQQYGRDWKKQFGLHKALLFERRIWRIKIAMQGR